MDLSPITHVGNLRGVTLEQAFEVYTSATTEWWPPAYTPNPATLTEVIVEPHVGGRLIMRHSDIGDYVWGSVLAWEPPRRLVHSFWLAQPEDVPSEVSIEFLSDGGDTEYRFEHRGWNDRNAAYRDKFGDWPLILDGFNRAALDEGSPD